MAVPAVAVNGKVMVDLVGGESLQIVGPASIKLKGVQLATTAAKGATGAKVVAVAAPAAVAAKAAKVAEVENETVAAKTMVAKGGAVTPVDAKGLIAAKGTGAKGLIAAKGAGAKGAAGVGNLMTLQAATPAGEIEAVVAKGAVGKGVTVATKTATATTKLAVPGGAGTAISSGAKAIATGGTIWTGKGMSLGLGLGLGAWGPFALGTIGLVAAAAVYGYIRKRRDGGIQSDEELQEAIY